MAESLLLPLVRGVAGKATDALVETVTRMCGLDDDRQALERCLLAVECKLANAEEMSETNPYVKSWMKELKSVAYQADDVLDDFQYEALRRQSKIGKSTTRKVLSYITRHSPLLFRFEMSRKLKNVLKKINKLVKEMNTFGLESSVRREERQHPWRQTHSKLDETTQIFGRDDDKEVVVKLLLDQQDQRRVQVLPIIGMGGLGKTTLAKMVYNDQGVQQHFELKMWHCVSDNFDFIALLKSIIELAVSGRCDMPDTIEMLQKKLEQVIGQKRFMLVLDDVWNEDERNWEDVLKPLLCSVGGPGSVIIVTTRSQKVASIMQTLRPHKLACLSEQDSWELFAQKAYSNGVEQEQAELVSIGRRIVNKCGGLPLALKTMGGLLSSYQQVQEWKAIEENDIGDRVRGKDEIMSILKLSYKHLSSEMKQCFTFLAVFPKDYVIDKDRLIQLWMANGFIQEKGTKDLTLRGEFIFNELVWRSFLQDKQECTHYYGVKGYVTINCKMHDLMHDLAKDVTDECASIEELTQKKSLLKDVCHMQMSKAELEQISGLGKGRTNLRTLLAPTESHKDFEELLQVSTSLRALHCSPSSIVICKAINAKHLRYLDLSGSNIAALPNSICVLYNLQTLRLIDCRKLQQLPEDMARLRKLIHLHLSGCDRLESMFPNFGLLNNLHILTTFVVGTGDGLGIEQLKDLQHLSNRLELFNLSKIKSGRNAKKANLGQKKNLSELLFSWDQEIDDEPRDVEEVLQCLEPHSNIQKLEIRGYHGLEISQWMRKPQMFDCLRELEISDCPKCKSIPLIWLSVSLEILVLQKMDNLTTLCNNIDVEAGGCITPLQIFPRLKKMRLIELQSLEKWAENSVGEPQMFNCLEELEMSDCPRCESIPVVWSSVSLEILCLEKMDNLKTLCNNLDVKARGCITPMQIFPRLKKMRLIELGSLEIWAENSVGERSDNLLTFPVLEELEIKNCPKLASIPVIPVVSNLRIVGVHSTAVGSVFMSIRLGSWPFLASLTLWSPEDIPMLPLNTQQGQSQRPLEKLKRLTLEGPNSLVRSSGLSSLHLIIWKCFQFVEQLRFIGCSDLVRWPSEELRCLEHLRVLWIYHCDNLEGNTSSSDEETLPLSLEHLMIRGCKSLAKLPWNLGNLTKLKSLDVSGCSGLKALSNGMCGLTSLRKLLILGCPALEVLPHGLLERLPALEELKIDDCPRLGRRCREGGEYFHLLSSVPSKYIL
ncbi:putative disease resistance protein RGA3 [Triticum urartu]|uniref:Disease resistance protein RGA3 n=1 Tax=Triticum urartu TaxID=4572 RepID=A0A8R7UZB1_TRIUA|nr:putative disease resistance protein RGA3 [Triticum urartu]